MPVDDPNVGVAFGLVCGAGLATAIGAAVVFFPSLVKLASKRVLAASLGISAGVMTYVSFVEIFGKCLESFQDAGHSERDGYFYATICFFCGVATMILLDLTVKFLGGDHEHDHHGSIDKGNGGRTQEFAKRELEEKVVVPHCLSCSEDPAKDLEEWQKMADEPQKTSVAATAALSSSNYAERDVAGNDEEVNPTDSSQPAKKGDIMTASTTNSTAEEEELKKEQERKKLVRMGINTALAVGLHNFPEGLATFVAALNDPRVGAVLAIAIGIHNIPEGLCVALPIYYATGNRCKAFAWALISGVAEPIAALLGWAVLANSFSDQLYGVLFGIVSGMMVMISMKELLPTAHRYDTKDTVVTYSFIAGMAIMALSLVLFMI